MKEELTMAQASWFSYHQPDPRDQAALKEIREAGKAMATTIVENTPAGPDRDTAITKIREACMYAQSSLLLRHRAY
jgi:hypothetical protein